MNTMTLIDLEKAAYVQQLYYPLREAAQRHRNTYPAQQLVECYPDLLETEESLYPENLNVDTMKIILADLHKRAGYPFATRAYRENLYNQHTLIERRLVIREHGQTMRRILDHNPKLKYGTLRPTVPRELLSFTCNSPHCPKT